MQLGNSGGLDLESAEGSVAVSAGTSSFGQVRFRSTSSSELDGEHVTLAEGKMRRPRQETFAEKMYRYRGVILVISVPIALISFVLVMMPRGLEESVVVTEDPFWRSETGFKDKPSKRYSVIFDAGSSGSRVHVFCFDKNVDLVKMDDGELELFVQRKPGLSNYSGNPQQGAESLNELLQKALDLVPNELHSATPVRLGATAGLRLLPGDASEDILIEVRQLLHKSGFKFEDKWVSILDGANEGTYQWITVNYLLGNLRKPFDKTAGVVDLGGGSVQMSYAVSEEASKHAPKPQEGRESYIVNLSLLGHTYHLYVYSYLRYGLYAVRAEILRLVKEDATCPCLLQGYTDHYKYGGETLKASAGPSGADVTACKDLVFKALKKDESCSSLQCTFGGVWSGGGGPGQSKLLVASFFFDKALETGIITDSKAVEATIRPSQFEDIAGEVCKTSIGEVDLKYKRTQESDRPYVCMDILYEYLLLVHGFGIPRDQDVTLVKKVIYNGAEVEAAWALGMAIESVSS